MITELLTWLTTRCASQARKLGYLYEAIAMCERAKRCAVAWQPHLQQASQFATDCLQRQPKGGIALVLGSGLGVDLPKQALLAHFDEIWLVDMVHLRATRRAWQAYPQVKFIERDVTDVVQPIVQGQLVNRLPSDWCDGADIRFVYSANILGQLPLQPLAWLAKHYPQLTDGELDRWSRQVLLDHVHYLQRFVAKGVGVCLVADLEWRYAEHNQVRTIVDAWRGLDHAAPDVCWEWRIAPRGEMAGNHTQTNWVGGWCW